MRSGQRQRCPNQYDQEDLYNFIGVPHRYHTCTGRKHPDHFAFIGIETLGDYSELFFRRTEEWAPNAGARECYITAAPIQQCHAQGVATKALARVSESQPHVAKL